ncbi:MAG: DUF1624 domain-containing protein [Clostridiales bacterium]|nr:DUF1624 domain-containing protein [Clostridiales bacterium]
MEKVYKKERINGIDFIRGLAVINMVLYHLLYDIVYIFNIDVSWFSISKVYYWQQAIVITFVFISGVSCSFSKHNVKRGVEVFLFAIILSVVTYVALPEEFIAFGILHFLGISIILFGLLKKLIDKIPNSIGAIGSVFLFLVTKGVSRGFIGIGDIKLVELPYVFYNSKYLFWLGFPDKGFSSGDYAPLFPWFFMLLLGFFSWNFICSHKYPNWFASMKVPVVNGIGRKSLWIYMLHQPIIYGILLLI